MNEFHLKDFSKTQRATREINRQGRTGGWSKHLKNNWKINNIYDKIRREEGNQRAENNNHLQRVAGAGVHLQKNRIQKAKWGGSRLLRNLHIKWTYHWQKRMNHITLQLILLDHKSTECAVLNMKLRWLAYSQTKKRFIQIYWYFIVIYNKK